MANVLVPSMEDDVRWITVERFIGGLDVQQAKNVMDAPKWSVGGQNHNGTPKPGVLRRLLAGGANMNGFYPRERGCLVEHAYQTRYNDFVRVDFGRCALEPGKDYNRRIFATEVAMAFDGLCQCYGTAEVALRCKDLAKQRYAALKIAELPFAVRKQDARVDVKPALPMADKRSEQELFAGAGV